MGTPRGRLDPCDRSGVKATRTLAVARLVVAALTLAAVLVSAAHRTGPLANYLSYFTVESNVLAIAVLVGTVVLRSAGPRWLLLRGASTFCLVVTAVVYAALLSGQTVGLIDSWVNTVLHRLAPLALLLDWLLTGRRIPVRRAIAWMLIPVAYFTYSLLRGPVADFYPYPFLDPRRSGGYSHVAGWALVLGVAMAGLTLLVGRVGGLAAPLVRRPALPGGGELATSADPPGPSARED